MRDRKGMEQNGREDEENQEPQREGKLSSGDIVWKKINPKKKEKQTVNSETHLLLPLLGLKVCATKPW